MKKIVISLIILIIIIIGILLGFYFCNLSPVGNNKTMKQVVIPSKSSGSDIAEILKRNHLINNEMVFKLYLKINSINNLKSGTYDFNESMNVKEIVDIIVSGKESKAGEINILFKEGLNMRQIAKTIANNTNNKEESLFDLISDKPYLNSLISKYWFLTNDILNPNIYYPLEGYLAPNTYRFANKNVSVKTIVETMLNQTDKVLTKYKTDIENSEFTIHQFLTMSSIVESEGVNDVDRPMIAGVFYNRLEKRMAFQSCVTVFYGLKENMNTDPLLQSELDAVNPYNTYLKSMEGKLPVGPVSNPGENSIKAAINPTTSKYLYFVSDKNKKTYFSETYSQHTRKIQELKNAGLWASS